MWIVTQADRNPRIGLNYSFQHFGHGFYIPANFFPLCYYTESGWYCFPCLDNKLDPVLKLKKLLKYPMKNFSKVKINSPCEVFHIEGQFIEANLAIAIFLLFVLSQTSTVMLWFSVPWKLCQSFVFFFYGQSKLVYEGLFMISYSLLRIVSFTSRCGVDYSLTFPILHFTCTTF